AFGQAVDQIASLRALLIVTFRSEFEPPWIGRSHVTALPIIRLAERDVRAMIDNVVGDKIRPLLWISTTVLSPYFAWNTRSPIAIALGASSWIASVSHIYAAFGETGSSWRESEISNFCPFFGGAADVAGLICLDTSLILGPFFICPSGLRLETTSSAVFIRFTVDESVSQISRWRRYQVARLIPSSSHGFNLVALSACGLAPLARRASAFRALSTTLRACLRCFDVTSTVPMVRIPSSRRSASVRFIRSPSSCALHILCDS